MDHILIYRKLNDTIYFNKHNYHVNSDIAIV